MSGWIGKAAPPKGQFQMLMTTLLSGAGFFLVTYVFQVVKRYHRSRQNRQKESLLAETYRESVVLEEPWCGDVEVDTLLPVSPDCGKTTYVGHTRRALTRATTFLGDGKPPIRRKRSSCNATNNKAQTTFTKERGGSQSLSHNKNDVLLRYNSCGSLTRCNTKKTGYRSSSESATLRKAENTSRKYSKRGGVSSSSSSCPSSQILGGCRSTSLKAKNQIGSVPHATSRSSGNVEVPVKQNALNDDLCKVIVAEHPFMIEYLQENVKGRLGVPEDLKDIAHAESSNVGGVIPSIFQTIRASGMRASSPTFSLAVVNDPNGAQTKRRKQKKKEPKIKGTIPKPLRQTPSIATNRKKQRTFSASPAPTRGRYDHVQSRYLTSRTGPCGIQPAIPKRDGPKPTQDQTKYSFGRPILPRTDNNKIVKRHPTSECNVTHIHTPKEPLPPNKNQSQQSINHHNIMAPGERFIHFPYSTEMNGDYLSHRQNTHESLVYSRCLPVHNCEQSYGDEVCLPAVSPKYRLQRNDAAFILIEDHNKTKFVPLESISSHSPERKSYKSVPSYFRQTEFGNSYGDKDMTLDITARESFQRPTHGSHLCDETSRFGAIGKPTGTVRDLIQKSRGSSRSSSVPNNGFVRKVSDTQPNREISYSTLARQEQTCVMRNSRVKSQTNMIPISERACPNHTRFEQTTKVCLECGALSPTKIPIKAKGGSQAFETLPPSPRIGPAFLGRSSPAKARINIASTSENIFSPKVVSHMATPRSYKSPAHDDTSSRLISISEDVQHLACLQSQSPPHSLHSFKQIPHHKTPTTTASPAVARGGSSDSLCITDSLEAFMDDEVPDVEGKRCTSSSSSDFTDMSLTTAGVEKSFLSNTSSNGSQVSRGESSNSNKEDSSVSKSDQSDTTNELKDSVPKLQHPEKTFTETIVEDKPKASLRKVKSNSRHQRMSTPTPSKRIQVRTGSKSPVLRCNTDKLKSYHMSQTLGNKSPPNTRVVNALKSKPSNSNRLLGSGNKMSKAQSKSPELTIKTHRRKEPRVNSKCNIQLSVSGRQRIAKENRTTTTCGVSNASKVRLKTPSPKKSKIKSNKSHNDKTTSPKRQTSTKRGKPIQETPLSLGLKPTWAQHEHSDPKKRERTPPHCYYLSKRYVKRSCGARQMNNSHSPTMDVQLSHKTITISDIKTRQITNVLRCSKTSQMGFVEERHNVQPSKESHSLVSKTHVKLDSDSQVDCSDTQTGQIKHASVQLNKSKLDNVVKLMNPSHSVDDHERASSAYEQRNPFLLLNGDESLDSTSGSFDTPAIGTTAKSQQCSDDEPLVESTETPYTNMQSEGSTNDVITNPQSSSIQPQQAATGNQSQGFINNSNTLEATATFSIRASGASTFTATLVGSGGQLQPPAQPIATTPTLAPAQAPASTQAPAQAPASTQAPTEVHVPLDLSATTTPTNIAIPAQPANFPTPRSPHLHTLHLLETPFHGTDAGLALPTTRPYLEAQKKSPMMPIS